MMTLRNQDSYLRRLPILSDKPKLNNKAERKIIMKASPSAPFKIGSNHLTPSDNNNNIPKGKKYFLYILVIIN